MGGGVGELRCGCGGEWRGRGMWEELARQKVGKVGLG